MKASSSNLELRNPHSILAALETRPNDVLNVQLGPSPKGAWEEVAKAAARANRPSTHGRRSSSGRSESRRDSGRHGHSSALVRARPPVGIDELFSDVDANAASLYLGLDHLQDPQNVGAIFRAAAFFGVRGIVVTSAQSAPLNGTVYDVASGGMEYVPFTTASNLPQSLERAKTSSLWVLGSSERGTTPVTELDRDRPWLLVLGSEEKGMRRLTEKTCDVICRLQAKGRISSLNVAAAATALMQTLSSH